MPESYVYTANAEWKQRVKLEYMEIGPNLNVYEYTNSIREIDNTSSPDLSIRKPTLRSIDSGFIDDEHLNILKSGKKWKSEYHDGESCGDKIYMLLSPEGHEFLRLKGYPNQHSLWRFWQTLYGREVLRNQGFGGRKFTGDFWRIINKLTVNNPYKAIKENENNIFQLTKANHESGIIFDYYGNALPAALMFNNADGRIYEGTYDFTKLVKHLQNREDITLMYNEIRPDNGPVSYNSVRFIWHPRKDDYSIMWAEAQKLYKEYQKSDDYVEEEDDISTQFHRAVFNADVLGLRECGAALCSDYDQYIGEYDDPDRNNPDGPDWM